MLFCGQNTHDTAHVSAMDGYKNDWEVSEMTTLLHYIGNLSNCQCYSELPYIFFANLMKRGKMKDACDSYQMSQRCPSSSRH